jgi:hypothetical protein
LKNIRRSIFCVHNRFHKYSFKITLFLTERMSAVIPYIALPQCAGHAHNISAYNAVLLRTIK